MEAGGIFGMAFQPVESLGMFPAGYRSSDTLRLLVFFSRLFPSYISASAFPVRQAEAFLVKDQPFDGRRAIVAAQMHLVRRVIPG